MRLRGQDSFIPEAKILRVLLVMKAIKQEKCSINSLHKKFDISERTVYRYVRLLSEADLITEEEIKNIC